MLLRISYSSKFQHDDVVPLLPFAESPLFKTKIVSATCLTRGEDVKSVYEIKLEKKNIEWDVRAGDAIGILPENDALEVDWILTRLNLNEFADQTYELSLCKDNTPRKVKIPAHIPSRGTLRTTFQKYLDIRSVPKKIFLQKLADYATSDEEKDDLISLTSAEKYTEFINNEPVTLFALLQRFSSCNPPIEVILQHLPALKPRFYSISSSFRSEFNCTFSVIEAKHTILNNFGYKGVCSGYLEGIIENCRMDNAIISFYFRTSSNFLVFNESVSYTNEPIILIAHGVGLAPFKGFLEDANIKNVYLFYGCRYSDRDFIYKDDVERFLDKSVIVQLFTAFSRHTKHKIYVQDLIRENGKMIADLLLEQRAFVRLCGDAKQLMKSVDEALTHILVNFSNFDKPQAFDYISDMKRDRRYCSDIWN